MTPLGLLVKYLEKIGKVEVYQCKTRTRIEWKLKPFAFFWVVAREGRISLSVKRLSFDDYVQIQVRKGYCNVTVLARLYFSNVNFPEEFLLTKCKIFFNSRKHVTIYFSDVQYKGDNGTLA